MDTIVIEVYLPAQGRTYEIRVPRALNCLMAANLTAQVLAPLSEGTYLPSHNCVLAWRSNGELLNMQQSLEQAGVKNGSSLLLL